MDREGDGLRSGVADERKRHCSLAENTQCMSDSASFAFLSVVLVLFKQI